MTRTLYFAFCFRKSSKTISKKFLEWKKSSQNSRISSILFQREPKQLCARVDEVKCKGQRFESTTHVNFFPILFHYSLHLKTNIKKWSLKWFFIMGKTFLWLLKRRKILRTQKQAVELEHKMKAWIKKKKIKFEK